MTNKKDRKEYHRKYFQLWKIKFPEKYKKQLEYHKMWKIKFPEKYKKLLENIKKNYNRMSKSERKEFNHTHYIKYKESALRISIKYRLIKTILKFYSKYRDYRTGDFGPNYRSPKKYFGRKYKFSIDFYFDNTFDRVRLCITNLNKNKKYYIDDFDEYYFSSKFRRKFLDQIL